MLDSTCLGMLFEHNTYIMITDFSLALYPIMLSPSLERFANSNNKRVQTNNLHKYNHEYYLCGTVLSNSGQVFTMICRYDRLSLLARNSV